MIHDKSGNAESGQTDFRGFSPDCNACEMPLTGICENEGFEVLSGVRPHLQNSTGQRCFAARIQHPLSVVSVHDRPSQCVSCFAFRNLGD